MSLRQSMNKKIYASICLGGSMSMNVCISMCGNMSIGMSKYIFESEWDYEWEYNCTNEFGCELMDMSVCEASLRVWILEYE